MLVLITEIQLRDLRNTCKKCRWGECLKREKCLLKLMPKKAEKCQMKWKSGRSDICVLRWRCVYAWENLQVCYEYCVKWRLTLKLKMILFVQGCIHFNFSISKPAGMCIIKATPRHKKVSNLQTINNFCQCTFWSDWNLVSS